MRKLIWLRCVVCFLAAAVLYGCGGATKVVIKQENYTPAFRAGEYGRFKGKTVILDNFTNQAANTKKWGYYSSDNKFYYEATNNLESHLWYCFQKAFQHAGMKVYDQSYGYAYGGYHPYHPYWWGYAPPPAQRQGPFKDAVEFQLVLTSMTDQECKFQVLLFARGGKIPEGLYGDDACPHEPGSERAGKERLPPCRSDGGGCFPGQGIPKVFLEEREIRTGDNQHEQPF
jgi:hypothetical protein